MSDTHKILNYLQANKERLSRDYHLTQIGLFGSMARGDQKSDSDIDIAIEFVPNTPDICRIKYIKPVFKNQILSEIKYV
jgi:predicted nucleotidyltransferase